MNNKFMSCPFCGKNPRILYQGRFCTIAHKNCASGIDIIGTFDSEDKAVKAWNTRYEKTCYDFGGEEGSNGEHYDFACSACGYCCGLPEPNFCPNCGARVEEKL